MRPELVTLAARLRALRNGIEAVHSQNGALAKRGWLGALKPLLKPAARVLPERWRAKGRQIWRHLSNP